MNRGVKSCDRGDMAGIGGFRERICFVVRERDRDGMDGRNDRGRLRRYILLGTCVDDG